MKVNVRETGRKGVNEKEKKMCKRTATKGALREGWLGMKRENRS